MLKRFIYPSATGFGAEGTGPVITGPVFVYFQSNYENTGDITSTYKNTPLPSQFQNSDADITINSDVTYVHSGTYSAKLHYSRTIPGDVNHALAPYITSPTDAGDHPAGNGLPEFYIRWYEYFRDPAETGGVKNGIQRKIFYPWTDPSNPANFWSVFLKSDPNTNGNLPLAIAVQNSPLGGNSATYYPTTDGVNATILSYNTWYRFEFHIKNDTTAVTWNGSSWSGPANGVVQLWINGTAQIIIGNFGAGYVECGTAMPLNLGTAYGLKLFNIGDAADSGGETLTILEDRYLNEIKIADSYIGA